MEFVQSMFIQCDHGYVKVFPNWTGADAKFENLRAKGCFLVSAEMKDGKVVYVSVKSEKGGRLRLVDPWEGRASSRPQTGECPSFPLPGWTRGKTRNSGEATLERDFAPGETVMLEGVFTLTGPVKTSPFRQAPFEWRVTPRHDYSKTYVTKLFLSQAEFDREYLGKFKLRDNGKQTVRMTCEKAFEAIKGMDEISLGLPKIVYLVGWQYNGHDSKYPAFFEGNREIARSCDTDPLDSVRWLMREAKKHHTAVSLHINLFDAYDDSPLFDEYVRADVLAKDKDGKLILGDWAYKVNYAAEWEKGLLQKRVDRLCSLLPIQEAGTIHVDAFHSKVPFPYVRPDGKVALKFLSPISPWHGGTPEKDAAAKKNIVKYFDSKGIDVTTEGVSGMDVGGIGEGWFPMYWHYGSRDHALSLKASQACGGNVYGSQCAFGRNMNGEKLFMDNPDVAKALAVFKGAFCKTTLVCQYLNRFGRKALIEGKDGCIGVFEDGVRTMWKGGRLSVAKDGELLCDGSDLLVPAVWLGDGAVAAYSEKGCRDRTWRIPSGTKLSDKAKAWSIDASGRKPFTRFVIDGDTVTVTLSPDEMVLIQ